VAGALIVARAASAESWEAHSGVSATSSSRCPMRAITGERAARRLLRTERPPIHVEGPQETTLVVNSVREVFQPSMSAASPFARRPGRDAEGRGLSGRMSTRSPIQPVTVYRTPPGSCRAPCRTSPGSTHFDGAAENQVLYLLNGFNITDPVSGRSRRAWHRRRALAGALERSYSPEYGWVGGAFAISTDTGTDRLHATATNFIPSVDFKQGPHLGNWTPRFGVSGPSCAAAPGSPTTSTANTTRPSSPACPAGRTQPAAGWAEPVARASEPDGLQYPLRRFPGQPGAAEPRGPGPA